MILEAELVSKYSVDTSLLDDADDAFARCRSAAWSITVTSRTMVLHGHLPRSLPSLDELKRAPPVRSVVAESEEDVEVVRTSSGATLGSE